MTSLTDSCREPATDSLPSCPIRARLPTRHGEFSLWCYQVPADGKEHLALVKGDPQQQTDVPVRIHSECLTGDVFGSLRCDCGDQLDRALRIIGSAPVGILLYLRQEGRGIGLTRKLEAYNLQDQGLDTVEANLRLGHGEDERDYGIAAAILQDLEVRSVRLITNNPRKIAALEQLGVAVTARIPIEIPFNAENEAYLRTKAAKMRHLLTLRPDEADFAFMEPLLLKLEEHSSGGNRPFITLSSALNLDGSRSCLPVPREQQDATHPVIRLRHFLRARHDGLIVSIDTVLADDPQLNVRFWRGTDPTPIVIDPELAFPEQARMLAVDGREPIVLTRVGTTAARRQVLANLGVKIVEVTSDADGQMAMEAACSALWELGIKSFLVEDEDALARRFLKDSQVDYCVTTLAPCLQARAQSPEVASDDAGETRGWKLPDCSYQVLDGHLIVHGTPTAA